MTSLTSLIAAALAAAALYALLCAVSPTRRCPACAGRKVTRTGHGFTPCARCRARGRVRRPGARLVHSLAWEHAAPWMRQRVRDTAERMRSPQT